MKEAAGVLVGSNCPGGFAVFGPYASVGAGQNVDFAFEITLAEDAAVGVELVADTGEVVFAAMPEQPVKKGEARRFGLRTRPQAAATTLEARIVLASEKPVSFSISDLALNVR